VSIEERFWSKVDKTETCWLWTAARNNAGYGVFWNDGKVSVAHRYAYESGVGAVPSGLQLDHLCRVRHCVNPSHLEPVTNRENCLRGESPKAIAHRTGICKYGHSLADAMRDRRGLVRNCRTCKREKRRSGAWSRGRGGK
jgi:hypothetical protein